jgi:hypothetical protein
VEYSRGSGAICVRDLRCALCGSAAVPSANHARRPADAALLRSGAPHLRDTREFY